MEIFLEDAEATIDFGRKIGSVMRDGDVICLSGDLGAGKTTLCKGICMELGVDPAEVTSPTFAIMNMYEGTILEIRHFDLYRINKVSELYDIGFYEYFGRKGLTLIEWGELFLEELPNEYLTIKMTREKEGRKAELIAKGIRNVDIIKEVSDNVNAGN